MACHRSRWRSARSDKWAERSAALANTVLDNLEDLSAIDGPNSPMCLLHDEREVLPAHAAADRDFYAVLHDLYERRMGADRQFPLAKSAGAKLVGTMALAHREQRFSTETDDDRAIRQRIEAVTQAILRHRLRRRSVGCGCSLRAEQSVKSRGILNGFCAVNCSSRVPISIRCSIGCRRESSFVSTTQTTRRSSATASCSLSSKRKRSKPSPIWSNWSCFCPCWPICPNRPRRSAQRGKSSSISLAKCRKVAIPNSSPTVAPTCKTAPRHDWSAQTHRSWQKASELLYGNR